MILTERKDFARYLALNKHFSTVLEFLENTDLASLEAGSHDIDGDKVFANCMEYVADGQAGDFFENHRRYIDIHLVLENIEKMALTQEAVATARDEFNVEEDYVLSDSQVFQVVDLTPNNLLVAFPEDLHQPKVSVNDQGVKKLVIKVLDEQNELSLVRK